MGSSVWIERKRKSLKTFNIGLTDLSKCYCVWMESWSGNIAVCVWEEVLVTSWHCLHEMITVHFIRVRNKFVKAESAFAETWNWRASMTIRCLKYVNCQAFVFSVLGGRSLHFLQAKTVSLSVQLARASKFRNSLL